MQPQVRQWLKKFSIYYSVLVFGALYEPARRLSIDHAIKCMYKVLLYSLNFGISRQLWKTWGEIVKELINALRKLLLFLTRTLSQRKFGGLVDEEKTKADMSWRNLSQSLEVSYNGGALMATGVSRMRLKKWLQFSQVNT